MASVLSITRRVVSSTGAALSSKTVTLKNASSGATVTTTTTDSDGYFEFLNQDESVTYKVEVAVGGSSTQKYVLFAAGGEFTYAYVRNALRTASGATVAFGGATSVAGALTVSTGGAAITGNSSVTGTLSVSSTLAAAAAVTVGTTLGVTGAATLSSTLAVSGLLTANANLKVVSNDPALIVRESDAGTDLKSWVLRAGGGELILQPYDDAESAGGGNVMKFTRTTNNLTTHQWQAGGVTFLKVSHSGGNAALEVNTPAVGTPNLLVKGIASQTANLIEAQTSAGTVRFAIGIDGKIKTDQYASSGGATPAVVDDAFPIYNGSGTLVGYVPIYTSI